MSDKAWYNDISALGRRPLEFFPTRDQTPAEKLNSIVRFVAYSSAAIAIYRQSITPLLVGVLVIAVVSAVYTIPKHSVTTVEKLKKPDSQTCKMPTKDNPFMNVLPHEYADTVLPACPPSAEVQEQSQKYFNDGLPREVSDVYRNRASDRQFITMPVTDNIPDTLAFRNFLAGK